MPNQRDNDAPGQPGSPEPVTRASGALRPDAAPRDMERPSGHRAGPPGGPASSQERPSSPLATSPGVGKQPPPGDSAPPNPQDLAPAVSLPKGGGALKNIGDKFEANAFTGSGGMSIPIAVSASRDLSPSLALGYSTGAGNGPFGMGWQLSVPSISRKTDRGLPTYD